MSACDYLRPGEGPLTETPSRMDNRLGWRRGSRARRSWAGRRSPREQAYEFRHALLREEAYDELLPGEREGLHLTIARALDARPEPRPAVSVPICERRADSGTIR
jgi:hypothetical protein